MTAGRPTKYDIGEEVPINEIPIEPWMNERELNSALLKNIDEFMETTFNEKVKFATDNKYNIQKTIRLKTGQLFPIRGERLDLWVECELGRNYIIELKNPKKNNYETFKALGQLLGYSVKFKGWTNLVLVSTVYDDMFYELIQRYKLPVDFVLINHKQTFLLKHE